MATSTPGASSQERRSRPKDRRQRILAAAGELFAAKGYHDVGMSDIASAVGIVPSALYRHYRSKHELLVAVLDAKVSRYEALLATLTAEGADDWSQIGGRVAEAALAAGAFDLVWSRDSGHLTADEMTRFVARVSEVARFVADSIVVGADEGCIPPRVTTWGIFSVIDWPGHRPLDVPPAMQKKYLVSAANAVVAAGRERFDSTTDTSDPQTTTVLQPLSRREAVLDAAIRLFAQRGYAAVSMDDIGEVVGIAGPSVYNYYPSKRDIIVRGVTRIFEGLWLHLGGLLNQFRSPENALAELVAMYSFIAYRHWDLVTVSLSFGALIDGPAGDEVARNYSEYVAEWRRLLMLVRPELDPVQAQALVDLAIAVINGVVRVPSVRSPALPDYARHLATAVLWSAPPSPEDTPSPYPSRKRPTRLDS